MEPKVEADSKTEVEPKIEVELKIEAGRELELDAVAVVEDKLIVGVLVDVGAGMNGVLL